MMKIPGCIAGIQYLPSIEYFAHWLHHSSFLIEKHEHFQKRTWRNRTLILGTQKPISLTVPLRKGKNSQMLITDVEISYDENWSRIHIGSLQAAYGKTPFFNEMEDAIMAIYKSTPQYLWELDVQLIGLLTSFLPGLWKIEYTSSYQPAPDEGILDLRQGVPAGETSITISSVPVYEQIQRLTNSHLPNLSILDVLCHLGPATHDYLIRYAAQLYI
jgi:hypothetical protein